MQRAALRRSAGVFALTGLLLTVGASAATAVDVAGVLRIPSDFGRPPPESQAQAQRSYLFQESNGFFPTREVPFDPARELSVVLLGDGPEASNQPPFRIANGNLMPRTLVARTGSTLRIENTDPCVHQLFAEDHSELNGREISPGRTRQLEVTAAGAWPLGDEIYEHVSGHLHVVDDLVARATVQPDGTFRFSDVPPGTYTLKVFHLAEVVREVSGVVVAETRELTVDPIQLGAQ